MSYFRLMVLRQMFNNLDTDKSGFLTTDEIMNALLCDSDKIGLGKDRGKIADLILKTFDTDGDGKVGLTLSKYYL